MPIEIRVITAEEEKDPPHGFILCGTPEQVPFPVTETQHSECFTCKCVVCVTPSSVALIATGKVKPVCLGCVEEILASKKRPN